MKKTFRNVAGILAATLLYFTPVASAQWSYVGTPGFSTGISTNQSMVLDSKGRPYVSYNDQSLNKGTVKMYDGSSWVNVGVDGFTSGSATESCLAISQDDALYFSYQDGSGGTAAVMHFNGTDWVQVGAPGISTGTATYTCIEVDPSGTPIIGYIDGATGRACVKYYDGTNWLPLGASAEVSPGGANYLSMDLDASGQPWIAFVDATSMPAQNVTAMYFDGANWQMAGAQGFTASLSGVLFIDLAISPTNEAYVVYSNPFASMVGGVHKFDGTSWSVLSSVDNPSGSIYNSIAVDLDNTPYVNYASSGGPASSKMYNSVTDSWDQLGAPTITMGLAAFITTLVDGNTYLYMALCDAAEGSKTSVLRYQLCNPADEPVVSITPASYCEGDSLTLTITTGSLNDDTDWRWYSGSCFGSPVGTGLNVDIEAEPITIYVNGGGTCFYAADTCTAILIEPNALPAVPVVTQVGTTATITSSSATGNQWYTNGNPIAGATDQDYLAPTAGWYYVTVTNASGCSSTSDSIFVAIEGVNEISGAKAQVYPVPFNQNLQVNLSSSQPLQMHIQDTQGRTVYTVSSLQMSNNFDLSQLANGLYYLVLQNENERMVYRIEKQ